MSEPVSDMNQQPIPAAGHSPRPPGIYTDWDVIGSVPPSPSPMAEPLQDVIEEILERLRASDVRRAGAMARLEGMLDVWSATDRVTPPRPEHAVSARPVVMPDRWDSLSHHDEARPLERARDSAAPVSPPLMAFESESSVRPETGVLLRAQTPRQQPERSSNQVVAWRPDLVGPIRDERRRPVEVGGGPSAAAARDDVALMLAARLDALELAIVVVKGEMKLTADRARGLQRRSSIALFLVVLSVIVAGVAMVGSARRVSDASARAATAQQQAEWASRQVGELTAASKRAASQGSASSK